MSLREKRLLHSVQTEILPEIQRDLDTLAGAEIELKIDWDSFSTDPVAAGNLQHQALGRIVDALRRVCRDEVGRKAVREEIQRISIVNASGLDEKNVTLDEGTLHVSARWGSEENGAYFTAEELESRLEDML